VAGYTKAVNGTVLILPATVSGVFVEIRIDGRAIRPRKSSLGVPERGGIKVLEIVGQTLACGRRDAILLPEIVADVPGSDP
jgi:hypothetical protein